MQRGGGGGGGGEERRQTDFYLVCVYAVLYTEIKDRDVMPNARHVRYE